ncbi:hypothetical protein SLS58_000062 [Diplodia intermedia]|uniref:Uncharacterized protein n=1 Tax=Diplodia intermedia TaxID=856260 RepID=A0ABR3U4N0_9PEZI
MSTRNREIILRISTQDTAHIRCQVFQRHRLRLQLPDWQRLNLQSQPLMIECGTNRISEDLPDNSFAGCVDGPRYVEGGLTSTGELADAAGARKTKELASVTGRVIAILRVDSAICTCDHDYVYVGKGAA